MKLTISTAVAALPATEMQTASTTTIEFTRLPGFSIDCFQPSPGWKRDVQASGSGTGAVVTNLTWSGGKTPSGEDSVFGFHPQPGASRTYRFVVRHAYSDGSLGDRSGLDSADAAAPTIQAVSSLRGGSSAPGIVALAVALVALGIAGAGLLGGTRSRA